MADGWSRRRSSRTPIVRVVACGSVDDGKSTLIGRLLAETDSVPDDILDYARNTRRSGSTIPAGEVDYSMLTDGLEAEHEQGITIDVAYRHLYLPSGRRVDHRRRPRARAVHPQHGRRRIDRRHRDPARSTRPRASARRRTGTSRSAR